MLERRTFIVRVHAPAGLPIVEDVSTGEQVRLPDLAAIADEIERRLDGAGDDTPPEHREPA
ncbi:MAG: hypothetical protein QOC68_4079 [Solirubrobacteraceae bacterium]|jgi:hypothetical protein|nr:hypothetical protein [Solirubrobacteraceae bacterium]